MTDRVNAALEEALAAAGFEISFTSYKVDLIPDGKIATDKAGLENKERVMHIGCFTNTYLPTINGVVRSVNSFRQGLTELGHNVFILAPRARRYKDTMPFVFRYPSLKIGLGYDLKLVMPVSRFANQLLPALKLDIIHSHHPFLLGEIAAKKAARLDLPLVFTFHTRYREYSHYAGIGQGIAEAVAHRRLSDYLKKCDQVIVPSNSIKQMLDRDYGTNQRVTVVPTGIDLRPYDTADGRPIREARGWGDGTVLVSVGRLAKEKNWETLLRAVARVFARRDGLRLAVIGDGVRRKAIQDLAYELGIAERVDFVGEVPFAEIPNYLKAADIFCFASITETQGLVTLEAMAARLPIVAVDGTGTRDAVEHGRQGLLTDNDSDALARAIEQTLDNPAMQNRFSQAATKRAAEFSLRRQSQKMLAAYEQAIETHQAGRTAPTPKTKRVLKTILGEQAWSQLTSASGLAGRR
jgi:glycosyltransferase involved in cell wall biosynthesis